MFNRNKLLFFTVFFLSCNSALTDYSDYKKIDYTTHNNLIKSKSSSYNGYSESFHLEGNKNDYVIGLPVEFINKIIIYKNKKYYKIRNKDYHIQDKRFFLFFNRKKIEKIEIFVTDKKIKFEIDIMNECSIYILAQKADNWLLNLW